MRRLLLLLFIGICPMFANAQRVDKPGESYKVYCYMTYYRLEITIDIFDEHYFLIDEEGKKMKFESSLDVLNYLSKRGWEFVLIDGGQYLLQKEVKSDEEAKKGLILLDRKKKKE